MNKIIILIGLLLVGAITYYSSYLIEKIANEDRLYKPGSIENENIVEEKSPNEVDMKVKDSIVEEIPFEEKEDINDEEEVLTSENEEIEEEPEDEGIPGSIPGIIPGEIPTEIIEREIDRQLAQEEEVESKVNKNLNGGALNASEMAERYKALEKAKKRAAETVEEKIIREEEEQNKAAIEENR